MATFKTTVIAVLLTTVVVMGFFYWNRPVVTQTVDRGDTAPVYGALAGPDIPSSYLSFGGVREYAYSSTFASGTSTLCAFQAPSATTTLVALTAEVTTSPSYIQTYVFGASATKNATTTSLANYTLTASKSGDIIATTSVTSLVDGIVSPGTWINLNISTSTAAGSNQAVGTCKVKFREV